MSQFMEQLRNDLITKKEVSDATATLYIKLLTKLNDKQPFKSLSFLKDKENILKSLESYSDNTKKSYLIAVVSALSIYKDDKPMLKKLYKLYYDDMIALTKEQKENDNNEKTEKEKDNWMSFEDVEKKLEELKKEVDKFKDNKMINTKQYNILLAYMVLSLFVYLPPRRNMDYQLMYVVKQYNNKMNSDVNYLDYDNAQFIFNKYKTSSTYGQQIIKFNDLKDIIDIYLKFHPLHKGRKMTNKTNFRFLVYSDGSGFDQVNSLTRVLNKIFDKNISSSMLRHIYLSSKYNISEMEDDAEKMAHNINTQREYLRKDERNQNIEI